MNTRLKGKPYKRSKVLKSAIGLMLFLLISSVAQAVEVRGRIDFASPRGSFPMAGAVVQICHLERGGCLSYRTGTDGMYYFQTVPGPHNILVNGRAILQIFIPNQPYFDIQPLRGN